MSENIHNFDELQKQMREALREEHPEWIEGDGASPMLDVYERRLAESLALLAAVHHPQEDRSAA